MYELGDNMTFTITVKDELSKEELNAIENRCLLLGYVFINAKWNNNRLEIILENSSVARKLFKTLKYCYNKIAKITVRTQKKFKLKTVYILEVLDSDNTIKEDLNNLMLDDEESKISFIKGIFLATGSISNPSKSYHLEMLFDTEEQKDTVKNILKELNVNIKEIKREKKFMLYLKSGEEISDFIKLLGTVNSLFAYEDIRIYKDHKNMVNRLNNCEQANLEKVLKTSDEQVEMITFLKENDYYSLFDEKTCEVADLRLKYPEESYQVLSDILSKEQEKKVTKSYINHHLRKIKDVYQKIINKNSTNS